MSLISGKEMRFQVPPPETFRLDGWTTQRISYASTFNSYIKLTKINTLKS